MYKFTEGTPQDGRFLSICVLILFFADICTTLALRITIRLVQQQKINTMLLAVSISISENIIFSASLMTLLYISSELVPSDFSILKFPSFNMPFCKLV